MAEYTISIREILQMHKQPGQDLQNPADVLAIGQSYIFDHAPINVINTNYREKFMTGFLLHFFNEEIGLETIPLWKIALNEKIINNSEYINLVFDNIDKQLFAEYKVKTLDTKNTNNSETTQTGSGSKTSVTTGSEHGTIVETHDDNTHKGSYTDEDGEVTTLNTGTITDAKTGTETLHEDGDLTNSKSGKELEKKSGDDSLVRTGEDKSIQDGEDVFTPVGIRVTAHKGDDTTLDKSAEITEGLGGNVTENLNVVDIHSDTPMGSLSNLRTPGGNAAGLGVTYQTGSEGQGGQTYNYMTDASERGQTIQRTDESKSQVIRGLYKEGNAYIPAEGVKNSYNSRQVESFADIDSQGRPIVGTERKDTTKYGKTITDKKDTTDTTNYNSTVTKEYQNYQEKEIRDLTNKTDYDVTNTQTLGTTNAQSTTKTLQGDEELTNTGSKDNVIDKTLDNSIDERTTNDNRTESEGSVKNTGTITDTTLNWEMIYKSMPLLNKVWELFDDIFMLIF